MGRMGGWLVGLLVASRSTLAVLQWDMPLADWEEVDCWDAATCHVEEAALTLVNPGNPNEILVMFSTILGPVGDPPHYSLIVDLEEVFCDFILASLDVSAGGPGFHYEFSSGPWLIDPCPPPAPLTLHVPPGDGCTGEIPLGYLWDLEHFPTGQVVLATDFTVPPGETLVIAPGMEVVGLPGCGLIIEGGLQALGTREAWISFHGEGWRGLTFSGNAEQPADLRFCRIEGADSPEDGGALRVAADGAASLWHCLIAHNHTAGAGGAAYVADDGVLSVYACTVSHNSGGTSGGVHVEGPSAHLDCGMCLMTFPLPPFTQVTGEGITNFFFTNFFPMPPPWPLPPYACDPGYVDPDSGDFHISYWDLIDPTVVNCIIDVSVNVLENDPDGTPGDMGAFPFDQHAILHPVRDLLATDRPGDEGGVVLLSFRASRNDGAEINPVTLYSIWERWPGAGEDDWVAAGTVAAMGDSGRVYTVPVSTQDDQFEGQENLHAFRVGTHSVDYPRPVFSQVVQGASLDDLPPPPPTGFAVEEVIEFPGWIVLHLGWGPSPAHDLAHYLVRVAFVNDFDDAIVVHQGVDPACELTFNLEELEGFQFIFFWVSAVDRHGNEGPSAFTFLELQIPVAEVARPAAGHLGQNHPNPANPGTQIRFHLAQAQEMRLELFNLAGQRVAVLAEGWRSAGDHLVAVDGGSLPSGVYFYRLETPTFGETRKMILAR